MSLWYLAMHINVGFTRSQLIWCLTQASSISLKFFFYYFCLCLVFFAACGLSVVRMRRICALVVVRVLLTAVASLVMEHDTLGMWASVVVARGLCSCRFQALEHRLNSCSAQA